MFERSFTLTVSTDAEGRFHSAQKVTSPFSLDVKITATLLSPPEVTIQSSFVLRALEDSGDGAAGEPTQFSAATGETVDLGKWRVVAGDDANVATAAGHTEPAAANTELVVEFVAAPSFF
jgi:hypothetical protein